MYRRLLILSLVILVASTSACSADWFGNDKMPKPTPSPRPDPTCATREVPAPTQGEILMGRKPALVPPGWSWIVIAPEVRALKQNDTLADYCVPFGLHVYATVEGFGPPVMIDPQGGNVQLPYDAVKATPWTGAYFILSYDPSSPRWANRAPTYEINVIATYLPERDMFGVGTVAAFRCVLRANGASIVQDMKVAETQMASVCNLKANVYNVA